ncbi:Techylectin-5B [Armadillidium nasatum]|uniref:Techylectin-5B n=1 Tax=Armadillidium nasatum TaxID=96803 RepID=A0A5N5T0N8_9CRUS|nr:Techylectin-5B [Armadillidium nasatum]
MIIFTLISFSLFVFTSGGVISDNSATVSLTEEELTTAKEVARDLKTFLKKNLEGQKGIRKVLEELDPSLSGKIKLTKESSIEEVLLKHQMILHQEMKEMFSEIKRLVLGHKKTDYAVSQIQNDQAQNDNEKKDSTVETFDSRGNNKIDNNPTKESNSYIPTDVTFRPADCSELLVAGYTESGVYKIYPFKCHCTKPVKAFCDMETDGGGWTIFLSRANTSKPINFTRNWVEYKNGFGTVGKEYWLGNEALHLMTSTKNYILRMEAQDGFGREIWGEWNSFSVTSEDDKYRLLVTTHNAKSSAFDRFSYVHNNYFSTFDVDNDKWGKSCAETHKGGWWYNQCIHNNPTGVYGKESNEGITLNPWSKSDKAVRYAKMLQLKIRPKVCSDQISVIQLNKHNCPLN